MAEENKSQQKTSVPPEAQDKLQSGKEHARRAAEDLKSAAGAFAEEYRGKAEQAWGEARGKQNKHGVMQGIAPGHSRKTQSNTCVKIRQRRFSVRSELGSSWV